MNHSIIFLASLLVTSASIVTANPSIITDTTNKDTSVISIKNKARIAKWTTTAACAGVPLFLMHHYKVKFNDDLTNRYITFPKSFIKTMTNTVVGIAASECGNYAERKVVNYYTPENNTNN